jgi:hypothetical protein
MLRSARWLFVVVFACLLLEGCVPPPKRLLDDNQRSVVGGREGVVVVSQGEIRGNIKPINSSAAGGGLVLALVDVTVNQIKANIAERQVTPLRNALADYDFDHHALAAMQATLPKIPWLDVQKVSFSKDASPDKLTQVIDGSDAPPTMVASYDYAMSPNFEWMAVTLTVGIYAKGAQAGSFSGGRLAPANALYFQRFEYISYLPQNLKDDDKNAASWAVDDGIQARKALDASLIGIHDLFVRSMSLGPAAAAALDQGRGIGMSDEHGSLVESGAKGLLLYNDGTGTWLFFEGRQASED